MLNRWLARLLGFMRRDDGVTSTQYAVVLALTMLVCLASLALLGTSARKVFTVVLPSSTAGKPRN